MNNHTRKLSPEFEDDDKEEQTDEDEDVESDERGGLLTGGKGAGKEKISRPPGREIISWTNRHFSTKKRTTTQSKPTRMLRKPYVSSFLSSPISAATFLLTCVVPAKELTRVPQNQRVSATLLPHLRAVLRPIARVDGGKSLVLET